jgi:mycofactocin precursor
VIVKNLNSKVTLVAPAGAGTTYAGEEASPQRTEVAHEEKSAAEKPRVSEEIAIEEINIDGMCGVY